MRNLIAAILALPVLAAAQPAAAQTQPRVDVYILQYPSSDGVRRHEFLSGVIQDKIQVLKQDIAGRTRSAGYIGRVKVIPVPSEAVGTDASLQQRWNQRRALMMLWGTINANGMVATSTMFVGSLAPPRHSKVEFAKIPLLVRDHRRVTDTHSLVVGYALLLDAVASGKPRDTIAAILAALANREAGLIGTGHSNAELIQIRNDIARIRRTLPR